MQKDQTTDEFAPLIPFSYKPSCFGHLKFDGMLMKAQPHFGSFLTLNTDADTKHAIPQTLRVRFILLRKTQKFRIIAYI